MVTIHRYGNFTTNLDTILVKITIWYDTISEDGVGARQAFSILTCIRIDVIKHFTNYILLIMGWDRNINFLCYYKGVSFLLAKSTI